MELRDAIRQNPMTRFQWRVVILCIALTVVDGYEILVTSFTLPALTREWDLSLGRPAWSPPSAPSAWESGRCSSARSVTAAAAANTS